MEVNMKIYLTLFIIIILGSFFRLYKLDSVPPSPSLDEVSIGWNAYSIFKTGRDEYGKFLPLTLRAYDDYRPALYVYLVIPFIAIMGLETIVVRLPSVVLSIVTIFSVYVLIKTLTKNKVLGLLTAFLLAISPWHIYISRLGHEANLGLSAGVMGITFFFLFIQTKKPWQLLVSSLMFVAALYGYQSQKIVIPIILVSLGLIFYRELWNFKRIVIINIVFSSLLLIPLIHTTFFASGLVRFQGTSAFQESNPLYENTRKKFIKAKESGNILLQIINYPRLTSLKIMNEQYLSHFSPRWLFTGEVSEAHKVPYLGLLYLWELPFILIGLFFAYKTMSFKTLLFIFLWFLSSPIPAAITTQAPHAMRSYTFLPLWQFFSAVGIYKLYMISNSVLIKKFFVTFVFLISAIGIKSFYENYYFVFPYQQSDSFSYANLKAFSYVKENWQNYSSIVVSNILGKRYEYPSYMFFLFYTRYDPNKYLSYGGTKSGSFSAEHLFDIYEFRKISPEDKKTHTLYINNYSEHSDERRVQYIGETVDKKPTVEVYDYE